jgi:hypothetical protein
MAASLRSGSEKSEVLNRLRAATAELKKIDEESGGTIDLSSAIETLRQAIRELEAH